MTARQSAKTKSKTTRDSVKSLRGKVIYVELLNENNGRNKTGRYINTRYIAAYINSPSGFQEDRLFFMRLSCGSYEFPREKGTP